MVLLRSIGFRSNGVGLELCSFTGKIQPGSYYSAYALLKTKKAGFYSKPASVSYKYLVIKYLQFNHNSLCLSHIVNMGYFIVSGVEFLFSGFKGCQGGFYVFIGMYGGWYQPVNNMSFRNDGINHNRAENTIILPDIHNHRSRFRNISFHIDRSYHGIRFADIKSFFAQAGLKFPGICPKSFFQ